MGPVREARSRGRKDASRMKRKLKASIGIRARGGSQKRRLSGASAQSPRTASTAAPTPRGESSRARSRLSRPKMRRICRRVAPTARSMAISSRLRLSWLPRAAVTPSMEKSSRLPPSSRAKTPKPS